MASRLPTDEELLRRMLAGAEEAFTALYERRQAAVYRFALQMSGERGIAEDVTQEVFLTLMREGGQFDARRGPLATYLYGIARHLVLRRIGRERAYAPIDDEPEPAGGADTLGDFIREEEVRMLRESILALPPHYREIVVLCELHEVSYAGAAAILGCAEGTVGSRLRRARSMLMEKLRARCCTR